MFNSVIKSVFQSAIQRNFCSKPCIRPVANKYLDQQNQLPRQVWIENMNTVNVERKGLLELHPDIFAMTPRIDIIHQNLIWQRKYRYVSFLELKTRNEMPGGGRKPWPQKGNQLK